MAEYREHGNGGRVALMVLIAAVVWSTCFYLMSQ